MILLYLQKTISFCDIILYKRSLESMIIKFNTGVLELELHTGIPCSHLFPIHPLDNQIYSYQFEGHMVHDSFLDTIYHIKNRNMLEGNLKFKG